jgi:hypothetical protein
MVYNYRVVVYGGERTMIIARALGDFFVMLWDHIIVPIFVNLDKAPVVLACAAGVFVLWRLSLAFGPLKKCWRCGGSGHVGGLLGGRKKCPSCAGDGLRARIGSK